MNESPSETRRVAAASAPETTVKSFCNPQVPVTGRASTVKCQAIFQLERRCGALLQVFIAVQFEVSDESDPP